MKTLITPILLAIILVGCGSDQDSADIVAKQPPVETKPNIPKTPKPTPNPNEQQDKAFQQLMKLDGSWVSQDSSFPIQLNISVSKDEIKVERYMQGQQASITTAVKVDSEDGKIVVLTASNPNAKEAELEYVFGVNDTSLTAYERTSTSSLRPMVTLCKSSSASGGRGCSVQQNSNNRNPSTNFGTPARNNPNVGNTNPSMGIPQNRMGNPSMGMPQNRMGNPSMGMPQNRMGNPSMGMPQNGMGNPSMGMPQNGMMNPSMGMPQNGMMNPSMGMPQNGMMNPSMGMPQNTFR